MRHNNQHATFNSSQRRLSEGRSAFQGTVDETRYHSQLEDLRSGHASDYVGDEDLFYDCAVGGRSTPNLGNTSNDTSGIMISMPLTPTKSNNDTSFNAPPTHI